MLLTLTMTDSAPSSLRTRLVTAEYQLHQRRMQYYKQRNVPSWSMFFQMHSLNIFAATSLLLIGVVLLIRWNDKHATHVARDNALAGMTDDRDISSSSAPHPIPTSVPLPIAHLPPTVTPDTKSSPQKKINAHVNYHAPMLFRPERYTASASRPPSTSTASMPAY